MKSFCGLTQEKWDGLTIEEKSQHVRKSDEKVKALADRTVAECKRQGFTVDETKRFLEELGSTYHARLDIGSELF